MPRTNSRTLLRVAVATGLVAGAAGAGGDPFVLSTDYLVGTREDVAVCAAVGKDGALWVVANSQSGDLPGAERELAPNANSDVVVLRLDPETRSVLSAAWLGGPGPDRASAFAFDADGNAYVAGTTWSWAFPTGGTGTGAGSTTAGDVDAFVARIAPDGSRFVWARLLGGKFADSAAALCVLPGGDPVVAGTSNSGDFPEVGAFQGRTLPLNDDGFVTRLAAADGSIVFSSRLGGRKPETIYAAMVSSSGGVLLAGRTKSPEFPGEGPKPASFGTAWSGFVTEVAADGSGIVRSRLFEDAYFTSIADGPDGSIAATGLTTSAPLGVARFEHPESERSWVYELLVARIDAETLEIAGGATFGRGPILDHLPPPTVAVSGGAIWISAHGAEDGSPLSPGAAEGVPHRGAFVLVVDASDFRLLDGSTFPAPLTGPLAPAADTSVWFAASGKPGDPLEHSWSVALLDVLLARCALQEVPRFPAPVRDVAVTAISPRSVSVTWRLDDALATGFAIDRSDGGEFTQAGVAAAGATEWIDDGVLPDEGFSYTVRALGTDGNSLLSQEVRALTPPSLAPEVVSGSIRFNARSTRASIDIAGRILPAAEGADVPDLGVERLVIQLFDFGEGGRVPPLDIAPLDPRWRRGPRSWTWRAGHQRFDWDPAVGEFRYRSTKVSVPRLGSSTLSLRFSVGTDAGTWTHTWSAVSSRELRTP